MAKYDGYILVTPCYNEGPPGGVKNAIDYLYNDIKSKPWMIVSYGVTGGRNAAESLATSLKTIGCEVVDTRPALSFARTEPLFMGMSADLVSAAQGKIGDASLAQWAGMKEEILKGFEEVKALLVRE
jgi:multimeric flavodoxin WrbA